VSRPDPTGADQIDAEHQATDLAVGATTNSLILGWPPVPVDGPVGTWSLCSQVRPASDNDDRVMRHGPIRSTTLRYGFRLLRWREQPDHGRVEAHRKSSEPRRRPAGADLRERSNLRRRGLHDPAVSLQSGTVLLAARGMGPAASGPPTPPPHLTSRPSGPTRSQVHRLLRPTAGPSAAPGNTPAVLVGRIGSLRHEGCQSQVARAGSGRGHSYRQLLSDVRWTSRVIPSVIPPGATPPIRSVLAGRPTRRELQGQHSPARRGRLPAVL
jgi:hypothetical protein